MRRLLLVSPLLALVAACGFDRDRDERGDRDRDRDRDERRRGSRRRGEED